MSLISNIAEALKALVTWWIVIVPWEQGVRLRWGKKTTILGAGIHLKIPMMHKVYLQTTRRRYTEVPTQTVTTVDKKTITLRGTLGYSIKNILTLYETLHHAEDTLVNLAQMAVAEFISTREMVNCTPTELAKFVNERIDISRFGLGDQDFAITDFAVVKTYRIIKDSNRYTDGDSLSTNELTR